MCQSCVNPILEATNLEPQQMDHVQSLWTREMDHASPKATNFCSFMWLKFEANQASCLFPGIASCRKKTSKNSAEIQNTKIHWPIHLRTPNDGTCEESRGFSSEKFNWSSVWQFWTWFRRTLSCMMLPRLLPANVWWYHVRTVRIHVWGIFWKLLLNT